MSQDIWTQCVREFKFSDFDSDTVGMPWRVVEAQHVIATRKLVNSDEEQGILEDLLEEAKPPRPYDKECKNYHYLLWTPFRYPPLKYGSRLGTTNDRGIWYGSKALETAFAEKAYYTILFRSGSEADFGVFESAITAFCVAVSTKKCADLTKPPFAEFEDKLSSPSSYLASQHIGKHLREKGAEAILFRSARCPDRGINLAVTDISAFKGRKPYDNTSWFCISSNTTVEFQAVGFQSVLPTRNVFSRADFEINGNLPSPATSTGRESAAKRAIRVPVVA